MITMGMVQCLGLIQVGVVFGRVMEGSIVFRGATFRHVDSLKTMRKMAE